MDFMKEYQKWLDSPVLTAAEKAELQAIANDSKEIESRFYGPWSSAPPDCAAPWPWASTT